MHKLFIFYSLLFYTSITSGMWDGKQFLIDNYDIALTPNLQLLAPKAIAKQNVSALIGGLTEARQGFSSLPNVESELKDINKQVPFNEKLNPCGCYSHRIFNCIGVKLVSS